MGRLVRIAVAAYACTVGSVATAGDFDGSRQLICAPVEAMDCTAGMACVKGRPDDIGAPAFMRIDFARKAVIGPKRMSEIRFMEKGAESLVLQGTEAGYAWTMALDQAEGEMSVSLVDSSGVFVLFGFCTPL